MILVMQQAGTHRRCKLLVYSLLAQCGQISTQASTTDSKYHSVYSTFKSKPKAFGPKDLRIFEQIACYSSRGQRDLGAKMEGR